jgi:thiamine-phosphate pyrophosphorylase
MQTNFDNSPADHGFGRALAPAERLAALRILDANANRASEGLRVVEDFCRFYLNDGGLSRQHKELRHDLSYLLSPLSATLLAASRETTGDVGTAISTEQESSRNSISAVATASSKRVEQALRVIEEQAKLLGLAEAPKFEALRYRAYTLAKAWTLVGEARQRLADGQLYVLIDGQKSEAAFVQMVESLVRAEVAVIQLRDKSLNDRTLLSRARLLRKLAPKQGTTLAIMNDRPDIALLAQVDGVHVGQEELTVREVRTVVGPEMLVGISTHTIEQARTAVLDGASYLGCGPTFPSTTKHFERFAGLGFLEQVAGEIGLPAFAIGGITQSNLSEVLAAGFTRVAVSGSITGATDAEEEARLMLQTLRRHRESKRGL